MKGMRKLPEAMQNSIRYGQNDNTDSQSDLNRTGMRGNDALNKDVVVFEGSFECANIEQVRRKEPYSFDVFMRNDTNGTGLLQWFYFKMKNVHGFVGTVRINIVNFTKWDSLFKYVSPLPPKTVVGLVTHVLV